MLEKIKDNAKYDLKTIKLKPQTYSKLIRAKARLEFERSELHSFDGLIDHLIESYLAKDDTITNDPARFRKDDDDI